jgi:hypothetical protein
MHMSRLLGPQKYPEFGAVKIGVGASGGEHQDPNAAEQKPETQDASAAANGIIIVDWDGPEDTENPLNWTLARKWVNMGLVSAITLLSYVEHRQNRFTYPFSCGQVRTSLKLEKH